MRFVHEYRQIKHGSPLRRWLMSFNYGKQSPPVVLPFCHRTGSAGKDMVLCIRYHICLQPVLIQYPVEPRPEIRIAFKARLLRPAEPPMEACGSEPCATPVRTIRSKQQHSRVGVEVFLAAERMYRAKHGPVAHAVRGQNRIATPNGSLTPTTERDRPVEGLLTTEIVSEKYVASGRALTTG